MKRMFLLPALFSLLFLNAQDFKYGITGNFHKGSIVNVHDVSKGKYGGGLGVFGEVPLVENDVFDSAWLYLVGQVEYSTQGENAKAEPDKFATQKFIGDYVNAMVYLKWFFHQGNMKRAPDIDPQEEDGGNPGDPVPVDDYVPLLFLAAAGIIIATAYRKKTA